MLPGMETLEPAENITSPQLMLYAAGFPASHIVSQEKGKQVQMSGIFGESFIGSFASLDRNWLWLKTCQGCCQVSLDGSLEEYSAIWPRSGIARNGQAYELQMSERLTSESEYSLWPTPRAEKIGGVSNGGDRRNPLSEEQMVRG